MAEALSQRQLLPPGEILRRGIPGQGVMLRRGLKILADGENVAAGFQNVVHQAVDLLLRFAQAHHEAGFGQQGGILLLAVPQHLQGPLIPGLGPDGALQLPHRLHIVVQHLRMGGNHHVQGGAIPLHVGDQRLHGGAGTDLPDGPDAFGELLRPSTSFIVFVFSPKEAVAEELACTVIFLEDPEAVDFFWV